MAEASLHNPYQNPKTCDLCDSEYDVLWHCQTCDGNLCTPCKERHGTTKIFQKHVVVSIINALKYKSEEKEACATHPSKYYSIHCDQCNVLICSDCAIEEHSRHKLGKIPEVMDRVCRELQGYVEEIETKTLTPCKDLEAKITAEEQRCQKWLSSIKTEVEKRRKELREKIDHHCNSVILQAMTESHKQRSEVAEMKETVQQKIKETSQLITQINTAVAMRNSQTLKFTTEKISTSDLKLPRVTSLVLPMFQPGKADDDMLQKQIGKIHIPKTNPQKKEPAYGEDSNSSKIKLLTTPIVAEIQILGKDQNSLNKHVGNIVTVNSREAWVTFLGMTKLCLVNADGKNIKTVDAQFLVEDFVVLTADSIIATEHGNTFIKKFNHLGQATKTVNTAPYLPSGICLNRLGSRMAVCLAYPENESVMLAVYNMEGEIIQEIHYTDRIVNMALNKQRVIQNSRQEYAVLDCYLQTVFVVTSTGKKVFSSDNAIVKGIHGLRPKDICYNRHDDLLILDAHKNRVYMLNERGAILTIGTLNISDYGITTPKVLDMDTKGRIWIAHAHGKVSIIQYTE